MRAETAATWVRRWVAVYTRGLPADVRRDRRDEIEGDIWSQLNEPATPDPVGRGPAGEMVLRLLFGIPADVTWRLDQIRRGRNPAPVRRAFAMQAPGLGLLAVIGGIGWAIWPIPQAMVGRDWPAGDPISWLLFITVVPGTFALAGAMGGLAARIQDRIPTWEVVLIIVSAVVGALSVFGAFAAILVLPFGSALLMWQLGRLGAMGPWLARTHVAMAVLWLVPMIVILANPALFDDPATAVPLLALTIPYALSWIAVGWSLYRASLPQGQAAG